MASARGRPALERRLAGKPGSKTGWGQLFSDARLRAMYRGGRADATARQARAPVERLVFGLGLAPRRWASPGGGRAPVGDGWFASRWGWPTPAATGTWSRCSAGSATGSRTSGPRAAWPRSGTGARSRSSFVEVPAGERAPHHPALPGKGAGCPPPRSGRPPRFAGGRVRGDRAALPGLPGLALPVSLSPAAAGKGAGSHPGRRHWWRWIAGWRRRARRPDRGGGRAGRQAPARTHLRWLLPPAAPPPRPAGPARRHVGGVSPVSVAGFRVQGERHRDDQRHGRTGPATSPARSSYPMAGSPRRPSASAWPSMKFGGKTQRQFAASLDTARYPRSRRSRWTGR